MSLLERVRTKEEPERYQSPQPQAEPKEEQPVAAEKAPAATPPPSRLAAAIEAGKAQASEAQAPARSGGWREAPNARQGGPAAVIEPRQGHHPRYAAIKTRVTQALLDEFTDISQAPRERLVAKIGELTGILLEELNISITRHDRQRMVEQLINDVLGLGPLEVILKDASITEIMINGPDDIYVEAGGRIHKYPAKFDSPTHLMQIIDRVVSSIGRRVDESSPMVDARLRDGSRVNVIIPPIALQGATMTIRRFARDPYGVDDLIGFGTMTADMAAFVRGCVRARMNVLISGGTGSGKTTTLNVLSGWIPSDERIITIEDAAELQLRQEHVVTLEARPANIEGRGQITIRDLVVNSLRMRPDRIVVGECRGGEALDMLQAMNTGHDGSLTTVHANSATDALSRLETLVLMAGADLPSRAIREQIASAINLVVQQARLRDGTRRVIAISEVLGFDGDKVQLADIFQFRQTGVDDDGHVLGGFEAVQQPRCLEDLLIAGEELDPAMFVPKTETAVPEGGPAA